MGSYRGRDEIVEVGTYVGEGIEAGKRLYVEVAACGSFSHGSNLEAAMRPEKGLGHNLRPGPGGLCPQFLKSLPSLPKPSVPGRNLEDVSYSSHSSSPCTETLL